MKKLAIGLVLVLVLGLVGVGFLITWDMPPPTRTVTDVLDDTFPR